jgi:hypothetical protein
MDNAGFAKLIAPQERSRHAAGVALGEWAKRSPRVLGRIPNKPARCFRLARNIACGRVLRQHKHCLQRMKGEM